MLRQVSQGNIFIFFRQLFAIFGGLALGIAVSRDPIITALLLMAIGAVIVFIKWDFLGLILLVFSTALLPQRLEVGLGTFFFYEIITIFILFVYFFKLFLTKNRFRLIVIDWVVLLLLVIMLVSSAVNMVRVPDIDFRQVLRGIRVEVSLIAAYFLTRIGVSTVRRAKWLVGTFIASGVILSISAIMALISSGRPLWIDNRAVTTLRGGYLGMIFMMQSILLLPFLFQKARSVKNWVMLAILVAILLVGLVLSFARSAWLGFALGCFIIAGRSGRKAFWLMGFVLAISGFFPDQWAMILRGFDPEYVPYTMERFNLWAQGWHVAMEDLGTFLFGIGAGNYGMVGGILEDSRVIISSHNNYIDMFAMHGFPAFILFSILHFAFFREFSIYASRAEKIEQGQAYGALLLGLAGLVVAISLQNIFGGFSIPPGLDYGRASIYFWIILALGVNYIGFLKQSIGSEEVPNERA